MNKIILVSLIFLAFVPTQCSADETDCNKLFNAVEKGELQTVKALLKAKCDPNAANEKGGAVLDHVTANEKPNSMEIAKLLIKAGADINAHHCESRQTALTLALSQKRFDLARYYIEAGADVNRPMVFGLSPLILAAGYSKSGDLDMVKLLVNSGADVNYQSSYYNNSALMIAAQNNQVEIVRYLVGAKANIDARGVGWSTGKTALMYAAQKNNIEVIDILIGAGADVNMKDEQGNTALIYAALNNRLEAIKHLIAKKADINTKGVSNWTALTFAAFNGFDEVSKFLLENKADPNTTDVNGWAPLSWAVHKGNLGAIKLLITFGANVNTKSESSWTPLLLAINGGYYEVVKVLIENGADTNAKALDSAEVTVPFRPDYGEGEAFDEGSGYIQAYGYTEPHSKLGLIDALAVANIALKNNTAAEKKQSLIRIIDLLNGKISKFNWLDKYKNIENKSKNELRLLRNEMFARHGCGFKSKDLKEYFASQDWYKYDPKCSNNDFSQAEKDILGQILKLEGKDPD